MRGGERIQITLKAGHHRPTGEAPFKSHFAGFVSGQLNAGLVACDFPGDPDQYC